MSPIEAVAPSWTLVLASVAVGTRLVTVTVALYALNPVSLSTTATRTLRVAGPSAVSAAGRFAVVALTASP